MQQITVTEGKGANLTEIKDVLSFSDKEIKVITRNDKKIILEGSLLKIGGFSKTSGELFVEGTVIAVRYHGKSESFLKKVFK